MLKHKKASILLTIFALVIVLCIGIFAVLEQSNAKQKAKQINTDQRVATEIAEAGLKEYKAMLNPLIEQAYDETIARYNQLSTTDKKGFEVDKIFYARAEALLEHQIGKEVTSSNYEKVNDGTPTTTALLKRVSNETYRIEVESHLHNYTTAVHEDFTLQLKVPVTKTNKIYHYQYAVHATNRVVAQKGSKIVGNVATAKTKNIEIDPSSCQYVQTATGGYYDKCYNDGNTDASPLKMRNAQSFNTYLPTFPSKDLEAFEALPISEEEQYLPIPEEDLYKEETEEDGTVRRVKKTEEELEPLKEYYVKDGIITMNNVTESAFTEESAFGFEDSEVHYDAIDIDGIDATIDIGDTEQIVRVNHFSLKNGATLRITGGGSLKLYIENWLDTDGQIVSENAAIETYIDGNKAITFSPNFSAKGLLYIKKASVALPGDGGFDGNIITGGKKLKIIGGENETKQLILAPKATVTLKEDTVFHGAIIAKNVLLQQGTLIFANPEDAIPIPLAVEQFDKPIQLVDWTGVKQN